MASEQLSSQTTMTNSSPVNSPSPQILAMNPYLIHHSDNPTAVLVSPPLTGDNYGTWFRAFTMTLRAKNKLGFVDGSIMKPNPESDLSNWGRCNDLVSNWILNSVSPDIRTSILYDDTAYEIWNDLYERFSQSNAPKIYQLKQAISSLKQENYSVSSYFTQLKSLWDELNSITPMSPCICGNDKAIVERLNQDQAMEFLQGLHDRFSAIRSQILLMDPFLVMIRMYALVRQEEKQQEINNAAIPMVESAALHIGNQATRPYSHKRQRPFCDHCNRLGHTKATCYKINGYPKKSNDLAAGTWINPDKIGSTSNPPRVIPATSFTPEQYREILKMISTNALIPSTNLAGPVDEEIDWSG